MTTYAQKIGARIRDVRKRHGLTQETFAKKFDIDKSTICRYETGSNTADLEFLEEFARRFKINGDWLLFGEPPIYKTTELNVDAEGLLVDLLAAVRNSKRDITPKSLPGDFHKSLEKLIDDTPENYVELIEYMVKYKSVSEDIFKYFHLFKKPAIDREVLQKD